MLQTQNLVKIYKPKKGVPVKALDNVTLTFPEKGMVFLLGKSGSGKSTLLNILGGLDRYNSGEILVMGKSTRKWGQSHFDSYRNTYVGFIFQEYNILDEFSVGANIALAIQLQGQKPSSQQVNDILKEVDLDGYGNRNPNELSGGQKQRVAIARALVKNPKIIMADEPTGALDSTTGRQVLNTLKKLSKDKLVIVVSHDRDFAEQYADRIIELADGKVIRDVERLESGVAAEELVPVYMEDSVNLPEEYILTDADKEAICDYIQKMVTAGRQPRFSLFNKNASAFQPTDENRISPSQEGYKLIKSRLPLKFAFKLGASSLKHKKFRLVMTILLSCIALGFFGLTDTMASYDYVRTAYRSLTAQDNHVTYAAFEKDVEYKDGYYPGFPYMNEDDLERIKEETDQNVYPVYSADFYIYDNLPKDPYNESGNYYMTDFSGCIEVSEALLDDMGAELIAGNLPTSGNEIIISTHLLETFQAFGYTTRNELGEEITVTIKDAKDILGLTLQSNDTVVTVCGVVDTGMDMERYHVLKDWDDADADLLEQLAALALFSELGYARGYSLDGLMMVNKEFIDANESLRILSTLSYRSTLTVAENGAIFDAYDALKTMSRISTDTTVWLDGVARTELADDEILMSRNMYYNLIFAMFPEGNIPEEYDYERLKETGADFGKLNGLEITFDISDEKYSIDQYQFESVAGQHKLKLVGIIEDDNLYCVVIPDKFVKIDIDNNIKQTLSHMPTDSGDILTLVEFSSKDFDPDKNITESYYMMNPVTFELKNLDVVFEFLEKVFFWIGLVFVVFASLLFSNFIGISISYKKEQIGILRAIGSRGNDVFRIFFAESLIIAMINFVLSFVGTIIVCALINTVIKGSTGMLLTVLNVSIRQALLILGVCLLSAFIACYIPVRRIASKRPIDAIRDR